MAGLLTLKELEKEAATGEIDTVVACFPDMQGRLVGKRFHAAYFLEGAHEETHGCDYLLANDIEWSRCLATRQPIGRRATATSS